MAARADEGEVILFQESCREVVCDLAEHHLARSVPLRTPYLLVILFVDLATTDSSECTTINRGAMLEPCWYHASTMLVLCWWYKHAGVGDVAYRMVLFK